MFIPYGTDAPLYHRPWATGALVLTNVGVFISGASFDLAMDHQVVEPLAWITSGFAHADVFHLLVNMMFPEHAIALHLETARALIESGRPASALELLDTVVCGTREEFEARERMKARAKELIETGALELDIEEGVS